MNVTVTYADKKKELERIFRRELSDREMVEAMCTQEGYYRSKLIDAEKDLADEISKKYRVIAMIECAERMLAEAKETLSE